EQLEFSVIGVKPDGTKIDTQDLKVKLYREEWHYTITEDDRGRVDYEWEKENVLKQEDTFQLQNGESTYKFEVGRWGDYTLVVEDPNQNVVSSYDFEVGWWWYGKRAEQKVNFDQLELSLDQDKYVPGDRARVKVRAPYDGEAYVFVENNDIQFKKRVTINDRTGSFTLPIEESYVPNMYVSVLLLRGTENAEFESYRAVGVKPVTVEAPRRMVNVSINPPDELDPGETQPVSITVTDHNGQPVDDGEVALSVVDQGILQLTDLWFGNAYDYFYRKRSNQVKNSDIYSFVSGEPDTKIRHRLTPSGAAPQEQAKRHRRPGEKQEFENISYWYEELS
ncbi:MAG: hypothetical protein ABEJ65_12005, partial [bacterium]